MLMPKKVKHRKQMRGRMTGVASRGSEISFGEYGLKCLEPAWITDRQIEAARIAMTRHIKRGGFNLTIRDPRGLQTLEPILTEADLAATSRETSHASAHLLSVLNFLRHQHSCFTISNCRFPIADLLPLQLAIGNWQSEIE